MFFLADFLASFGFSYVSFVAITAWNGIKTPCENNIQGVFDRSEKVAQLSKRF